MKTLKDLNELSSFACMKFYFENWKVTSLLGEQMPANISFIYDIDNYLSTLKITNKLIAEKFNIETLFLNQKELS